MPEMQTISAAARERAERSMMMDVLNFVLYKHRQELLSYEHRVQVDQLKTVTLHIPNSVIGRWAHEMVYEMFGV